MKKAQISFVCQECGYDSPKFLGKCPECGNWNTMKEFKIQSAKSQATSMGVAGNTGPLIPKLLKEIAYDEKARFSTGFPEFDGVLGGGVVNGSVTLLAGDPGVGKSTLLLQVGLRVAQGKKVLYISGEESEEQVKLRAERIVAETTVDRRPKTVDKYSENFLLVSATNTDAIANLIVDTKPDLVVIDSIQTMEGEGPGGMAGSVSQIRYATAQFIRVAKTQGIPTMLVGHVTKEGMVAGPMVLSHMVDVVLFLEGEKNNGTRILRSLKNRFGPVDEVGVFQMTGIGLEEIANPQQLFSSSESENIPGAVRVVTLEGSRAFLIEVQALVVFSKLPIPRRVASGVDNKRLELLLAVLQKQCQLPLAGVDVFVSIAGGLKVSDPAVDLGICLAIYSSFKNKPLRGVVGISEVGLLGELRMVPQLPKRVKEAEKLGLKKILTAKTHKTLASVLKDV